MIEFIRHALGLCGEHWHPNIFTIIGSGFGLVPAIQYLKIKYLKNGNSRN
jgi:hypothetical protein